MSATKKKEPSELPFRNGSSGGVVSAPTSPNSSRKIPANQSVEDFQPSEFDTKFSPKMKAKSVLSESFLRLGSGRSKVLSEISEGFEVINPDLNRFGFSSRSERVSKCGSFLEYIQKYLQM